MDFSTWTKQDFIDFDNRRAELFATLQEEIQAAEQKYTQNIIDKVQALLQLYSIEFTGDETDFTDLYALYIKWDWTNTNPSMAEWIWSNKELDNTVTYLTADKNNLKDFCNFVLQYE